MADAGILGGVAEVDTVPKAWHSESNRDMPPKQSSMVWARFNTR
jgi:hypothetical protein